MKVISIIQPWATLIMLGEKKFETRSWERDYRGELGIHASKKMNRFIRSICNQEPFHESSLKRTHLVLNRALLFVRGGRISQE